MLDPGLAFGTGSHPTTALCLRWLDSHSVKDKVVIDYGCGSGILAIAAILLGAKQVVAVDNDPQALIATRDNAKRNTTELVVMESDLFAALDEQVFEMIVINPPYFRGEPENEEAFAWYAGPNFEYFSRLFADLGKHVTGDSRIWMILSEDVEIDEVARLAGAAGWDMQLSHSERKLGEWNYIYAIQKQ